MRYDRYNFPLLSETAGEVSAVAVDALASDERARAVAWYANNGHSIPDDARLDRDARAYALDRAADQRAAYLDVTGQVARISVPAAPGEYADTFELWAVAQREGA